jgi:hypothetical protein
MYHHVLYMLSPLFYICYPRQPPGVKSNVITQHWCCNLILTHWIFYLILQGLKYKIKRSEIYFNEKYGLLACVKTRNYNVFLSFYPYLQDNPCLQDNDSYLLSNLILNQIQTSKKRMSLIEILFCQSLSFIGSVFGPHIFLKTFLLHVLRRF